MQAYRRNSPEAAARIVALALVSDGNVCRAEFEAVSHLGIETQLGLQFVKLAFVADQPKRVQISDVVIMANQQATGFMVSKKKK